jgi:hypothetical protein
MRNKFVHIARKVGLEDHLLELYFNLNSATEQSIKTKLESINFPEIDVANYNKLALFPLFHSESINIVKFGLLAHALKREGIGSLFIFGDGSLPACKGNMTSYQDRCKACVHRSSEIIAEMNISATYLDRIEISKDDNNINSDILSEIRPYAISSVKNHLHIAELDLDDDIQHALYEDYLMSSKRAWLVMDIINDQYNIDYVISTGSPYVPRGVCIQYSKLNDIPTYGTTDHAYGRDNEKILMNRMIGELAHEISNNYWREVKERSYSEYMTDSVRSYMNKRTSDNEYLKFASTSTDPNFMNTDSGTYAMFTHLAWDGALYGNSGAFDSHLNWIVETIDLFRQLHDKELIVKPHPAEKIRGTNQGVVKIINDNCDVVPENITLLSPETELSPYELLKECDVSLVYRSTVGMEAIYFNCPTVIAGDAHYSNRGFGYCPQTNDHYADLIRTSASKLSITQEEKQLCKKYIYNYFLERPIDFPFINPDSDSLLTLSSYDQLIDDERLKLMCKIIKRGDEVVRTDV